MLDDLRGNVRIEHIMTPSDHVYKPLVSEPAKNVRDFMKKKNFDMAPVLQGEEVTGIVWRRKLKGRLKGMQVSEFKDELRLGRLLSANTPLDPHLGLWERKSYFLVNDADALAGIVTYADLNKAPPRLVFYVILSEIENKLRKLIRRMKPNDAWMNLLKKGKRRRIVLYYRQDKGSGLDLDKTTYLQFWDLLSLFENEELYRKLRFSNIDEFASVKKELNEFRNDIMHSHSLVTRKDKMRPNLRSRLQMLLDFEARIPIRQV